MNWAATPLGPLESWPPSLRTAVGLVLSSQFPISMAWGPSRIQIYNDAYRPFCGAMHPDAMGKDFRVCWASAWATIGEMFDRAFAGVSTYLENQRMFLNRHGYLEEAFFTYSYSPIRDETGSVAGMFCPVTESTPNMLSQRRTRILRDLSAHASGAQGGEAALVAMAAGLEEASFDLPFLLIYLIEPDEKSARLVARVGFPADTPLSRATYELTPSHGFWPLFDVVRTGIRAEIEHVDRQVPGLQLGPYPEPVERALALPLSLPGGERPVGVMLAGVSARLRLNDGYRTFYDLLAAGISREFSNASAYEQERRRAEALLELDRAKTAFFSNVSHEFRTPLTLLLGPLEDELNERDQPFSAARRARLKLAQRNALRLLKLVNTLLDVSRIEAGRMQAHYEPVDLAAYTSELASVFRSAIEHAGLTLTVHCETLPEPVYVDRDLWEKLVMNLVSNAFKHTFEGGISVRLVWRESHVELAVQDTGVGIAEPEIPRVFDRFHRIRDAKARSFEGTGIGLNLVREIALAHGGDVRVESRVGLGSTFYAALRTGRGHLSPEQVHAAGEKPRPSSQVAAYVQEAEHWLPKAAVAAPAPAASPHRARVLLVDDNADMRDYVTRLLDERYEVLALGDGQTALERARVAPPDLVLSDVMMPGLDGFGLLRALRAERRTKTIPIILLSARAGEESIVEGLSAGADDYLVKPFAARELLARVQTHLELAEQRRAWASELERANRELESFSYSVSHDLRAPLRAIDGFSKRLIDRQADFDDSARADLGQIRLGVQRMTALIDDLLELSRASRQPLRKRSLQLDELAKLVFEELSARSSERRARLEVQPGLDVDADPNLLRVAFENLLGNALKFSAPRAEPSIRVGKLERPGPTTFYVADNGVGFDMKYVAKLFQPFSRLHSTQEFEGTGIGLTTVQRIVARHGGRLWAEATPGQGATFYFTLASEA
ncbi:MAG TPA: ATP-binding protein [Polyangiales bacterium]|nr:ATP-binding protein [Polyangiales bacterium]